ncbi:MAG: HAD family phosphatase [Clostridia bacterium]|nr:HAD family phosphatase [Clostridia bacterium]
MMQLITRRPLPTIRAVLFDMDGLLVDSERLAQQSCLTAGREMGYPIDERVTRKLLGCTHAECARIISEAFPGIDTSQYFARSKRALEAAFRKDLQAKPGAAAFARRLSAQGIPYAIASSSSPDRIEESLALSGLASLFPVRLTGDDVKHSKPEPDLFLAAAERLGVSPADCLVLEDSVNGIKAGRAAESVVCMVPDLVPYSEALAPWCDAVASSLEELPGPFRF